MTFFGEQVIALLDHLEIDEAVIAAAPRWAPTPRSRSAALAPERLRGMVIEMPVLDGALLGCALAFTPLMRRAELRRAGDARSSRPAPSGCRGCRWLLDFVVDTVRQDPAPSAAVLQGLFFGRIAPHRSERRRIQTPTLVIGHRRDPVHPFSDAGMLAEELPNGRLLEASSILELRSRPSGLPARSPTSSTSAGNRAPRGRRVAQGELGEPLASSARVQPAGGKGAPPQGAAGARAGGGQARRAPQAHDARLRRPARASR